MLSAVPAMHSLFHSGFRYRKHTRAHNTGGDNATYQHSVLPAELLTGSSVDYVAQQVESFSDHLPPRLKPHVEIRSVVPEAAHRVGRSESAVVQM